MVISKYFVFFIFYSFLGWIYESCYCTIHEHSWQNRGFLYGPCVPIYGIGATVAQILFNDLPIDTLHNCSNLTIFLSCAIGSFFLEYITSFVLEKKFHARWWDYSNLPLNINGRVCLLFTACFGIAGVVIVNFVIPPIANAGSYIHPLVYEIISLVLMLLLGMDLALTVSAVTSFSKEFERINEQVNNTIAEKYESLENGYARRKIASIEKIEEGKEALFVRKELTSEKLSDIKEQLSMEYIAGFLRSASKPQISSIRSIAKFTHPVASTKGLMEKGAKLIKSKKEK